jgi:glutathione synthase
MKSITVIMDPIEHIKPQKDSSFAVMLKAQSMGIRVYYVNASDVFIRDQKVQCVRHQVALTDNPEHWFEFEKTSTAVLADTDVIFLRKDPPFDMDYIYLTYLLELAEKEGVLVMNQPQSVRDCNEKLFTTWFPECCPETLVTRSRQQLNDFLEEHKEIICKPLDGMGGSSVFYVHQKDLNKHTIFDTLTSEGKQLMMAQRFIPSVSSSGDKRIIIINGEPMPYALARIPAVDDVRANLAAGGRGVVTPLTDRDRYLCDQIAPTLKEKGLLWVGLDVIGDYVTEINVTSPTCIREIEAETSIDICARIMAASKH